MPLPLPALVDLEALLARDRSRPEAEVARRDAGIAARLGLPEDAASWPPERRGEAIQRWLDLAWQGEDRPGPLLARALGTASRVLAAAGLLCGASTMAVLLRYDGTTPINVVSAIGVMVALQLAILAALLLRLRHDPRGGIVLGRSLLHEALRILLYARTRRRDAPPLRDADFRTLFGEAETWLLVRATQAFGVAFNVGALACGAYLVTFTDLAFAWATTLRLTPQEVHAVTEALATPFAFVAPEARPSLALIEATQYFRYDARYSGASGMAGGWWPFLFGCILVYGLLPRAALLGFSGWRYRRARARLRLDSVEAEALWHRLTRGTAVAAAAVGAGAAPSLQAAPAAAGPCVVVGWRDVPASDAALSRYASDAGGASPLAVVRAGGAAGDLDGAAAAAAAGHDAAVVVVADGFGAFDKALARFATGMRGRVGATRKIWIAPVEADAAGVRPLADTAKLASWRRSVAAAGDRYLGVLVATGATP